MSENALSIAIDAKSQCEILKERFDRHLNKQDQFNEKIMNKFDELKDLIVNVRVEAKDADNKIKLQLKDYGFFAVIASGIYGLGEGIKHLFK